MILFPPAVTRSGDEVQISVRVRTESARAKRGLPSELWFRFPAVSQPSHDLDPFAVALLLVAMQNNEPLEIHGSISRKLLGGLEAYQRIYRSWFPERFHLIEIRPESLRDDPPPVEGQEACAFSGGVDSFYSLLALKDRLTHTLFMAGFDMPLHLAESTAELTCSYTALMKDLGLTFIAGSTNVRAFVDSADWTNAHGQALGASALFFRNSFGRFHIPSSYELGSYPRWGTHPILDPLFSSESLAFSHHGADANRVRKLEIVSKFPASHDRLRVCWIQSIGLRNCGECEKCIRTMIALELVGALPAYRTFPAGTLTRARVREIPLRTHQARLFSRELVRESLRRRKLVLCVDLGIALLKREWNYRVKKKARAALSKPEPFK